MPDVAAVMAELREKATEQTRRTYLRHGIPAERMFGVSIADLKKIARTMRGNQELALALYETGNMDAMYLAGMVVDGAAMTRKQLDAWARQAAGLAMIAENTLAWVTVESPWARELAMKWIGSKQEHVASSGWATYAGIVATVADQDLDKKEIEALLDRVAKGVHEAPNRVRYAMNGFVIAVGTYVKPLLARAKAVAREIGVVEVDMGDTACRVPLATDYIAKIEGMGRVGRKRETIRC